jgi:hypothetical protein
MGEALVLAALEIMPDGKSLQGRAAISPAEIRAWAEEGGGLEAQLLPKGSACFVVREGRHKSAHAGITAALHCRREAVDTGAQLAI